MTPDYYELHLLGMAVEACRVDLLVEKIEGGLIEVGVDESNGHHGPTLAQALAALLDDLGVEYPEPPSAERVAAAGQEYEWTDESFAYLRDLYAREPLTVLALLGGEG